jgi:hypothetical protein
MTQNNDIQILELLQTEWQLLKASLETLQLSVEKCRKIGVKQEYSFEEQESFDSLTSKFSRTSDLFTLKVIRTTWLLLHESFVPFIDMMNICVKMEMLQSTEEMIGIRDMRNQIAHEYIPDAFREMVPEVIEMTHQLVENIKFCQIFLNLRKWIIDWLIG